MNSINKKLNILKRTLAAVLNKDIFLKEASLQRSVDITSYGRKVLNLFFPYLADRIVELSESHKEAYYKVTEDFHKEKNRINSRISDIGSQYGINSIDDMFILEGEHNIPEDVEDELLELEDLMDNTSIYFDTGWKNKIIKISFEKDRTRNIIKVFYKGIDPNSSKTLIKEISLDIFSDEEKKIFLETGHAFNLHLRDVAGGNEKIQGGAVAMRSGVTLYNPTIFYDNYAPYLITNNISKLYDEILEQIVHESTHIQQFILEQKVFDRASEMGPISEDDDFKALITDRGYIRSKDPNILERWIRNNIKFDDIIEEDDEDIPDYEEPTSEASEGKFDVLSSLFGKRCPEIYALAMQEFDGTNAMDLLFKYKDHCSDEADQRRANNESETYHKEIKESGEESLKKYFAQPIEIEAFIRGLRAINKGKNKTFASSFSEHIASRFKDMDTASELWELYKQGYKRLNYPEKDLGTDQQALSTFQPRKRKSNSTEQDLLSKLFSTAPKKY
jgi:hypothetical protein